MAGISFTATVIEPPDFNTVGKNKTPLAKVKVSEEVKKKEGKKWVVTGHNNYEINIWGDKAVEASGLSVGDKLDFRSYIEEDYIRHRAKVEEQTWEYQGKEYSKLVVTAFEYEVIDDEE